jgi:hypothetical protein
MSLILTFFLSLGDKKRNNVAMNQMAQYWRFGAQTKNTQKRYVY